MTRPRVADRGAAVAIGNFDGVHPGHQAVIAEAGGIARGLHIPHAVLTFEPHPFGVFKPDAPPFRLTPFRAKARQIETLGVDLLFAIHFDLDFAKHEPADFVDRVLIEGLGARHVVVGYDFVFGRGRRGNSGLLKELGARKGFGVTVVEADIQPRRRGLFLDPHPRAVDQGQAARGGCAARPFLGDRRAGRARRGRTRAASGLPTANLPLADYLRPAAGIYAVYAGIEAEGRTDWHDGVAYLGRRATLGAGELRLEAHLFDFSGDLSAAICAWPWSNSCAPTRSSGASTPSRRSSPATLTMARAALAGAGPAPRLTAHRHLPMTKPMNEKADPDSGKDYRSTVFLPETDFPMRGELPKREPALLERWQKIGLWRRQRAGRQGPPEIRPP